MSAWARAASVTIGALWLSACSNSEASAPSVAPPMMEGGAGVTGAGDAGVAVFAAYKPLLAGAVDKGSESSYHAGQSYPVTDPASNGDTLAASSPAFGGLVVRSS
jgi:hypothetical protein